MKSHEKRQNENLAQLDRLMTMKKNQLAQGETLYVQVVDGFLAIRNEINEDGEHKPVIFFSPFDAYIELDMGELAERPS
ncbi:hypothetical protein [Bhargavaea beijingensis]|uniref:hypothetical protein n=1 Tax=Bhargavaea beijingensis TaxID=426756 RepID=UPI0022249BE8|nr:hypothetical protein [Bhargavaea beijingensis]MCW1929566.1 hypothetical protein [Bhargavaea beijingensis]